MSIKCGYCKDCAHWNPTTAKDTLHWKSANIKGGFCLNENIREPDGADRSYTELKESQLVYSYNEGGNFWTGPTFGCVHFNQK